MTNTSQRCVAITLCRYVQRNALRAKLVRRAEDWAYGSLSRWHHKTDRDPKRLTAWQTRRPRGWFERVRRAIDVIGAPKRCGRRFAAARRTAPRNGRKRHVSGQNCGRRMNVACFRGAAAGEAEAVLGEDSVAEVEEVRNGRQTHGPDEPAESDGGVELAVDLDAPVWNGCRCVHALLQPNQDFVATQRAGCEGWIVGGGFDAA